MTKAQEDAVGRIMDISREHFEAGVMVFNAEYDDHHNDIRCVWHGGYASAMGLLTIGKIKAWDTQKETPQ